MKSNGDLLRSIDTNVAVMHTEQTQIKVKVTEMSNDIKEMKTKQATHDVILTKGAGKIARNWDKANELDKCLATHLLDHKQNKKDNRLFGLRVWDLIIGTLMAILTISNFVR